MKPVFPNIRLLLLLLPHSNRTCLLRHNVTFQRVVCVMWPDQSHWHIWHLRRSYFFMLIVFKNLCGCYFKIHSWLLPSVTLTLLCSGTLKTLLPCRSHLPRLHPLSQLWKPLLYFCFYEISFPAHTHKWQYAAFVFCVPNLWNSTGHSPAPHCCRQWQNFILNQWFSTCGVTTPLGLNNPFTRVAN